MAVCPRCDGDRYVIQKVTCRTCKGTGLQFIGAIKKVPRPCGTCQGTGKERLRTFCHECHGTGQFIPKG